MVNPGGESTMLGQWRIVLRQAEEAARLGRYEEAYALATRPGVADHHHAVQFRSRLALDLIARATRRGGVDDLAGAIEDLDLAERIGAPPDSLAAARLNLADRVADEVRVDLDAGEPVRVLERVEELARHKIGGPALRRAREIAEAWQNGLAEGRRGEFGRAQEQLDRADRLAAGAGAIAAQQAVSRGQGRAGKSSEGGRSQGRGALRGAFGREMAADSLGGRGRADQRARTSGRASGSFSGLAADCGDRPGRRTMAASGCARAPPASPAIEPGGDPEAEPAQPVATEAADGIVWLNGGSNREAGQTPAGAHVPTGIGGAAAGSPQPFGPHRMPTPARPLARVEASGPKGRFLLWVDAVGGYLVCLDDRILLGRAGPDSHADIPLMGDLSRNHATLLRNGEGYLLQAHHASFINGKPVVDQAVLHDGDVIRLGSTVELEFRQPSPVSATARLSIVSRHRLPLAVDGVLLMAETCIVGSESQAHIPAPALKNPVVLYRQAGALWCRAIGAFDIDGRTCASRAPLTLQSSVLGDGFSFSLEPLGNQSV